MWRKPTLPIGLMLTVALVWVPVARGAAAPPDGIGAALDTSIEAIVDEATQERDKALLDRERQLTERETRITRMRTDLEALIARNEALRKELMGRQETLDKANKEKIRKLIKLYEAMAPEEAAPILVEMKESVVLSLFAGMKGKAAAGIMEFIPKPKAARLGEKLAKPY